AGLRYAADPRLVPSLRAAALSGEPDLVEEAMRALARIEDPRVHPTLVAVQERTPRTSSRIVASGALGCIGDSRGRKEVREAIHSEDPGILFRAVEALAFLGGPEDTESVAQLLAAEDPELQLQAVRTLGRIGDARALAPLGEFYARTTTPALQVEVDEARTAVLARLELRGEEVQIDSVFPVEADVTTSSPDASAWYRFRALRHYLIGRLWLLLGALDRASRRFDAASAVRPGWAPPYLAFAIALEGRALYARALVGFRRALEVDRASVERNPLVMPSVARCFLRRAEELFRDDRSELGRGLLDEALALDLRWAPSALRFELGRMRQRLGRGA
ncbi:MAG: hypothetical protein KC416_16300, partial [Myxococcales bacterium]|nr:hypothetical protein [Myxococcales bacterium]